jgi:1-deoxy-D-xylulose 5-phosphate reductoisomerase
MQIPELIEKTLLKVETIEINSVDHVIEVDKLARIETNKILNKLF